MDQDAAWTAINELLHFSQTTAKNTAEQNNVRAFAALVTERLRMIQRHLSPHEIPPDEDAHC